MIQVYVRIYIKINYFKLLYIYIRNILRNIKFSIKKKTLTHKKRKNKTNNININKIMDIRNNARDKLQKY